MDTTRNRYRAAEGPVHGALVPPALLFPLLVLLLGPAAACSPSGGGPGAGELVRDTTPLTAEELEKGIGPVDSVAVSPGVDPALAERGEHLFRSRCVACHRLADRSVGPPLGDVTVRRSREFVMNMILNPREMVERHPEIRALRERYPTPMTDQGLTQAEARTVLEYLRRESRAR